MNVGYQWNGQSLLAGDVKQGIKGDMPDQFNGAVGTDVIVNPRMSLVFDVLTQRLIDTPRLTTFPFVASGPFGDANLHDLRFETASEWATSGAVGLKANVASRLLIDVNLKFALSNGGLTDRLTPLVGIEYAF